MFDSEKCGEKTSRMWVRLARQLEKLALERAGRGHDVPAVRAARLAAACFWEATGEAEWVSMSDLMDTKE